MNTKQILILAAATLLALGLAGSSVAQSEAPYTEGPVWQVTMIKTKPGMGDDYLTGLAKTKASFDELKKANLIVDYKILNGQAATPQDFDVLIMVEYKNMAAFDGLRDKTDPITSKVLGSVADRRQVAVKRLDLREIMGTKQMREINLK